MSADHKGMGMAGNMLVKATSFWTVLVGVKVPKVTLYFWIIKVLCTTVGETFADLLVTTGGLGLETTTGIMFGILGFFLIIQFALTFYLAPLYWLVVVIVSTAGTLVTDTMTDASNVPLWASSLGFTILLACTFGLWYLSERTLAIHSIYTRQREAFYWLVILFTFGLGTAVGDWISEGAALGYGNTVLLFAAAILVVALLWYFSRYTKVNTIACFWVAYILTRPLGASIGDFLSQTPADYNGPDGPVPNHWVGGCALGTAVTSGVFLGLIGLLVLFLFVTKKDKFRGEQEIEVTEAQQVVVVSRNEAANTAPQGHIANP